MAGGGGHAGVAVEGDLVGAQHVAVLPGLDVTGGGDQGFVLVVIHLVGGEGDRLVLLNAGPDERLVNVPSCARAVWIPKHPSTAHRTRYPGWFCAGRGNPRARWPG